MGDISQHFSRAEFACSCGCGFAAVDHELLQVLETMRMHFDAAIQINSGCRCAAKNQAVGGASRSQHLLGMAADVVVAGVPAADVAQWLRDLYPSRLGVGEYASWVHVDVRPDAPARWGA